MKEGEAVRREAGPDRARTPSTEHPSRMGPKRGSSKSLKRSFESGETDTQGSQISRLSYCRAGLQPRVSQVRHPLSGLCRAGVWLGSRRRRQRRLWEWAGPAYPADPGSAATLTDYI